MLNTRVPYLLQTNYPIIQAPMTWLTSAKLVAAVSNAGGLGVLGPNAGQTIASPTPTETAEKLRQEIIKTKQLTNNSFAVNYILPNKNQSGHGSTAEKLLEVIFEENIRYVIAVGYESQDGEDVIKRLKAAGVTVVYRNISPTVNNSLYAEQLGIDAIIITGHEAGGHLSKHRISTLSLLSQVTEHMQIPVIAAGGIYNEKTAKAAFAMGAEGISMGTRFINTIENPASELCKNAIIQATSEQLQEIATTTGFLRITNAALYTPTNENYLNAFKLGMLEGDLKQGFVCVSESAGGINNILSCQQVIDKIVQSIL